MHSPWFPWGGGWLVVHIQTSFLSGTISQYMWMFRGWGLCQGYTASARVSSLTSGPSVWQTVCPGGIWQCNRWRHRTTQDDPFWLKYGLNNINIDWNTGESLPVLTAILIKFYQYWLWYSLKSTRTDWIAEYIGQIWRVLTETAGKTYNNIYNVNVAYNNIRSYRL